MLNKQKVFIPVEEVINYDAIVVTICPNPVHTKVKEQKGYFFTEEEFVAFKIKIQVDTFNQCLAIINNQSK